MAFAIFHFKKIHFFVYSFKKIIRQNAQIGVFVKMHKRIYVNIQDIYILNSKIGNV